jgi:hypothetical protein
MAAGAPRRRGEPNPRFAFPNIPFDKQFEPLYLAFIAGLSGFGLVPQTVLQIPGSQRRLDRLTGLMSKCQYSFHDLSRVELDGKRPRVPRFNMPFELGAAVGMTEHSGYDHFWYAFEAKEHRALKSISDLNGTEVYVHNGKPVGVFRCLANALARSEHRPTVRDLQAIYRDVMEAAQEFKRDLATDSLYDTRPFQDSVIAASISARRRIASLRDPNHWV